VTSQLSPFGTLAGRSRHLRGLAVDRRFLLEGSALPTIAHERVGRRHRVIRPGRLVLPARPLPAALVSSAWPIRRRSFSSIRLPITLPRSPPASAPLRRSRRSGRKPLTDCDPIRPPAIAPQPFRSPRCGLRLAATRRAHAHHEGKQRNAGIPVHLMRFIIASCSICSPRGHPGAALHKRPAQGAAVCTLHTQRRRSARYVRVVRAPGGEGE